MVANLPMPQFSTQIHSPTSQLLDIYGDPGPGPVAAQTGAKHALVGTKVYRVWGTNPNNPDLTKQSGPWGQSWTTVDPSTVPNYREAAGLPSGGESGARNAGRFVSVGIINDASGVQVRSALCR
jgi:hypothetical protein